MGAIADLATKFRKRPTPAPPFSIRSVEVTPATASEHPRALLDISEDQLDSVVIRGVLSPEEVDHALRELDGLLDRTGEEMFGFVLGMPLFRLGDDDSDRQKFYAATAEARALLTKAFGFEPHDRIRAVLESLSGGLPIEIPNEDGNLYNPGTARWYLPGQGGLYPHAGTEFVDQNANGALTHLLTLNEMRGWTSWFMVLQRPDSGGTLTVYDLLYRDRPPELDEIHGEARDPLFSDLPSVSFDIGPGDLIAFCGGRRYHRIEDIGPGRPRVTYGGFLRQDRTGRAIHVWA